ncbi:hypothetical protein SAMN05421858_4225 [Haladaptatus litoreus]|uniref:Uncharacterized protein n=1 Tax=Haladaptatus litoreus TaxID=553468 RepID=A0A1N7EGX5_9EURY|nr:hypothetical protein SAMN05421858_4225 [Haladaptatus litoreus]
MLHSGLASLSENPYSRITQRDKRNPVVEGFVFESDLYLLGDLRCKPAVVPNEYRSILSRLAQPFLDERCELVGKRLNLLPVGVLDVG